MSETMSDIQNRTRVFSDWNSVKGLRTDILPWRLWEKAKKLHWDPAEIDFSQDRKDWEGMPTEHRLMLAGLANGFMVGEEGVTLDIMPLLMAIADEGRTEEAMFLTTFAYEEAKHVDFFHRWFQAIGADPLEMRKMARANQEAMGVQLGDPEQPNGLFESILPRVMRRVLTDRSPKAFLSCSVTYNQFIEGCLAIAGYRMWGQMFDAFQVMPGLRKGLEGVQADERRHIAYGTYLCRRILAAHPELLEGAIDEMYDLRDMYVMNLQGASSNGNGELRQKDGSRMTADELIAQAQKRAEEMQAGSGNGAGGYGAGGGQFQIFGQVMLRQVERRIRILQNATKLDPDAAERGVGAEEVEIEIEQEAAQPVS